jgi:multiple sugar transport system substrate-binding protein
VKETIGCHLLPSSRCRCSNLTIETYASAADETTKIQSSVVAGSGPNIYNLGTTFTPVATPPRVPAKSGFDFLTCGDAARHAGDGRLLGGHGPGDDHEGS